MTVKLLPELTRWAIARNILGSLLVLIGSSVLTVSLEQILAPENADDLFSQAWRGALAFVLLILAAVGLALVVLFIDLVKKNLRDALNQSWIVIRYFIPPTGVALSITASLFLTGLLAWMHLPAACLTVLGAAITVGGLYLSQGFWGRAWRSIKRAWHGTETTDSTNREPGALPE